MSFLFDIFCSRGIKSSLKSGFFFKFKPGEHLVTFFCSNALHGLTVLFHGKICALCCNKRQCYSGENFQRIAISVSIVSFVFLITFGELILCKE